METTSAQERIDAAESAAGGEQGLQERMDELRQRLQDINERVKDFIKKRPAACLMGAMALGYLVARIARKGGWR